MTQVAPGYEAFSDSGDVVAGLLRPSDCALVVVDVQNDYCHPDGALGAAGFDLSTIDPMVEVIERLVGAARRHDVPVVFLHMVHSEVTDTPAWRRKSKHAMSICRRGSWGAGPYRIAPEAGDVVVEKHRYSGFVGTRLETALTALGRTTLVMAGTATNVCVESTARHACMLDYDVLVVSDAVAATDASAHRASLENLGRFFGHVVSSDRVKAVWRDDPEE